MLGSSRKAPGAGCGRPTRPLSPQRHAIVHGRGDIPRARPSERSTGAQKSEGGRGRHRPHPNTSKRPPGISNSSPVAISGGSYAPALTSIFLATGFAAFVLPTVIFNTPLSKLADVSVESISGGRARVLDSTSRRRIIPPSRTCIPVRRSVPARNRAIVPPRRVGTLPSSPEAGDRESACFRPRAPRTEQPTRRRSRRIRGRLHTVRKLLDVRGRTARKS